MAEPVIKPRLAFDQPRWVVDEPSGRNGATMRPRCSGRQPPVTSEPLTQFPTSPFASHGYSSCSVPLRSQMPFSGL